MDAAGTTAIGMELWMPYEWDGSKTHPDIMNGLRGVVRRLMTDDAGRRGNAAAGLSIVVRKEYQGKGIAGGILSAIWVRYGL